MELLCVLTTILGHKTVSKRIRRAVESVPGVHPTYALIRDEDHTRPLPRWKRAISLFEAVGIARLSVGIPDKPFGALLINAWELAVAFPEQVRRLPTVMVADAIPSTINVAVNRRTGATLKRKLAQSLNQWAFGRVVRDIDYFLVKSTECARALQVDFGIPAERCLVTRAPVDIHEWKPAPEKASAGPRTRLLFVGNDLARKGGDFLLNLFTKHLGDTCTLTMISTDPKLAQLPATEGIRFIPGMPREELPEVFRNHDVFVFPTTQDFTPEVVAEALAVGLPCVMGEVDGAHDLVRHGENGYVLPLNSSTEHWVEHILRLTSNPAELARQSAAARAFAEQELSLEKFDATMAQVLGSLKPRS